MPITGKEFDITANITLCRKIGKKTYLIPDAFQLDWPDKILKIDIPVGPPSALVSLEIYNLTGSKILTLFSGDLSGKTHHKFIWNGKDMHGMDVMGGIYFVRANISGEVINHKLVVIR